MRIADTFLMASMLVFPSIGQTVSPSPADNGSRVTAVEMYAWFFGQVSRLANQGEPLYLNGQLSRLRPATLQQMIGLSDIEADKVKEIARAYESAVQSFDRTAGAITFNARIEAINPEHPDPSALTRFAALMESRRQMIRAQVETLRHELGNTRFQLVERFVFAAAADRALFPLVTN